MEDTLNRPMQSRATDKALSNNFREIPLVGDDTFHPSCTASASFCNESFRSTKAWDASCLWSSTTAPFRLSFPEDAIGDERRRLLSSLSASASSSRGVLAETVDGLASGIRETFRGPLKWVPDAAALRNLIVGFFYNPSSPNL